MSLYVNVGQAIRWPASQGRDTVRKFGESFELPDAEARESIIRNTPMMAKQDFDAIGFTADELSRYASPGAWASAPQSFQDKLRACWIRLAEIREQLLNPPAPPEPPRRPPVAAEEK